MAKYAAWSFSTSDQNRVDHGDIEHSVATILRGVAYCYCKAFGWHRVEGG